MSNEITTNVVKKSAEELIQMELQEAWLEIKRLKEENKRLLQLLYEIDHRKQGAEDERN